MTRVLGTIFFFFFFVTLSAQSNLSALLPMPNHVEVNGKQSFRVKSGKTAIAISDDSLRFEAEQLAQIFQDRMEVELPIVIGKRKKAVNLEIDRNLVGKEHYVLEMSAHGIRLKGATSAALYRGVMTLDQLLLGDVCATAHREITSVFIDDSPRFPYRSLMLDPARHFLPLEDVKFYIDQMARYKYNVLQLHLTDDQGWRLEIKRHPRLASQEHYSQEEIRDLIEYAALRHVEIVPEIDVPGHTVAILSVYPDLACQPMKSTPAVVGKTVNRMLCAANPETYHVLKEVIEEVCGLFDAPYIHLGGDEAAVPYNWAKCPDCQALMQQKGYTLATQLMIPFFESVLEWVRKGGKRPILWCELDNIYPPASDYLFPYPKDVVLVSWRNGLTPTCQRLTSERGNSLLMAPGEYAYFDYPQWKGDLPEYNNWGMPTTSLQKTYQLDPGYGRPESEQCHILGVIGTLWGEAIPDINRATYMTYPRALALAEAGWTQMPLRDWNTFKQRIYPNLMHLMKSGVSVRVPFEIAR